MSSPLLYLAIPVAVFIVGSSLLWLKERFFNADRQLRRAPEELQAVAPMLRQQRENGWRVESDSRRVGS